jgi:hypothetical protein
MHLAEFLHAKRAPTSTSSEVCVYVRVALQPFVGSRYHRMFGRGSKVLVELTHFGQILALTHHASFDGNP